MPQMGFDMQEGRIVRWLKKEGDRVSRGESIAEIETDKAVIELEAFGAGILRRIVVGEDQTVPVGTVVALIAEPDEDLPESASPDTKAPAAAAQPQEQAPPAQLSAQKAAEGVAKEEERPERAAEESPEVKASPVARRLAEQAGIDLTAIDGTGPQGRVVKADVERAIAEKGGPAPAAEEKVPQRLAPAAAEDEKAAPSVATPPPSTDLVIPAGLSTMRRAIARRMAQSKREVPHFYVTMDVDMTRAMAVRQELNADVDEQSRVSVNDLIIRACVKALQKYPAFNVSALPDGIKQHDRISISLAIALEGGLIAPALVDVDRMTLREIARASKELVEGTRRGRLSAEQYAGGTFTISNMGMYGVSSFTAIITPPNAAALAVGQVEQRAVVREGQVTVAHMMSATLSADHRVTDGAEAAEFLGEIRRLLEKPTSLLV